MKLKYYCVSLDGIDKSGKSTLVTYLAKLSNYTLNILDRGPITNIVWNKIQQRNINYELDMWKNTLFVRLNVNEEDWKIRCSIHHEPTMPLTFNAMNNEYDKVFLDFKNKGFQTLEFNTSKYTQYQIAQKIIKKLYSLNLNE